MHDLQVKLSYKNEEKALFLKYYSPFRKKT